MVNFSFQLAPGDSNTHLDKARNVKPFAYSATPAFSRIVCNKGKLTHLSPKIFLKFLSHISLLSENERAVRILTW